MFFYLYDTFVLDKSNASLLDKVEARIIELGINGRVEKLTPLRNMKDLIENGIKNDAHTIVVVGNDQTFLRALQIVTHHNVVLGFLPFGESHLAKLLGIADALDGCNALSRRITKQLPLGKANQSFFLLRAASAIPASTRLKCNEGWSIVTQTTNTALEIKTENNQLVVSLQPQADSSGFLRKAKSLHPSHLAVSKVTIEHPDTVVNVTLDDTITINSPVTCSLKQKGIKVIVGKQRLI